MRVTLATYTTRGTLFRGDCLDLLTQIESESVDTIFADPPFNLAKCYGNARSDLLPDREYLEWCYTWLNGCVRVLKPGGSIFIHNLPKWNVFLAHYLASELRLDFRHWIAISLKNGFARGKRLYPAHYSLIYFSKGAPAVFNRESVRAPFRICRYCGKPLADWGGYRSKLNPRGVNLSDVWTDLSPVRHARTKQRPFGINELNPVIPERAILLTTNPGDIVLDPFGGGGGTYRMAEKHDRLWIGSEIGDCTAITDGLRKMTEVTLGSGVPPTSLFKVFRPAFRRWLAKALHVEGSL